MTRNEVARLLTKQEKGLKQINIAQMSEIVKALHRLLHGRRGGAILKGILNSVGLLLILTSLTGCAALSYLHDAREKVELWVGSEGPGEYAVTVTKDGQMLWTQRVRCDRGPDGKLAGCHRL